VKVAIAERLGKGCAFALEFDKEGGVCCANSYGNRAAVAALAMTTCSPLPRQPGKSRHSLLTAARRFQSKDGISYNTEKAWHEYFFAYSGEFLFYTRVEE
jgi:hypothetical protein